MVIDALDSSLGARTALLVNYSAVLNADFYVMKMSLVELYPVVETAVMVTSIFTISPSEVAIKNYLFLAFREGGCGRKYQLDWPWFHGCLCHKPPV